MNKKIQKIVKSGLSTLLTNKHAILNIGTLLMKPRETVTALNPFLCGRISFRFATYNAAVRREMALTIEGSSDMDLLKSRIHLPVLVDDPGSGDRPEADVLAVITDGTAAPGGPDESG